MKKTLSFTILFLLMILMATVYADMQVPASLQVALFYKIFDFDQSLTESASQQIVIGIFYDPNDPQSVQVKNEIKENFTDLAEKKIGDKNVTVSEITTLEQLKAVNIVYVTPGVDSSIAGIIRECQEYKVLGISGVEKYARKGVVITIGLVDQKPKIIINKKSADLDGVKLSSKILAIAEII